MVWFWKKKKPATAADATATATASGGDAMAAQAVAAQAEAAVQAAVEDAQRSDKEWRRQAARLRDQEKRLEKERARAAKRELALMKKQARAARRERRQAEKRAQKQAKAVLKVHLREQKAERKRVQTLAKLRRRREKRDKKLLRRRQKEERRRRRRARAEDQARVAAAAAAEESEPVEPQAAMEGVPLGVAPSFKEDARCKSCSSQFQRLPTRRRHHCRNCGESFCSKCLSRVKRPIPWFKLDKPQKVCFSCDVQVFNGMGGAARPTRSASSDSTAPSTPPAPATPGVEVVQQVEETSFRRSPLRAQRSASFQSEQPEDSPRTASPPGSRNGLSFRLRPRSRRDASSSKSKKGGSIWTLPIRPLLKRKASADQLRNRSWDLDLRIEKEEMLARQRQALMVVPTRAPQFATAS